MATRSYIGMRNENGKVDYIYCHWDGYPEHHWPILNESYATKELVNELLELGNLSSLGNDIGSCEAYHRDRGESRKDTRRGTSEFVELIKDSPVDYVYVLEADGKWKCYNTETGRQYYY